MIAPQGVKDGVQGVDSSLGLDFHFDNLGVVALVAGSAILYKGFFFGDGRFNQGADLGGFRSAHGVYSFRVMV
jgi:hypothetical protein